MNRIVLTAFAVVSLIGVSGSSFAAGSSAAKKSAALSSNIAASGDQNQDKDGDQLQTFNGTILSMNGDLFTLRDDTNQVWFHLDDQKVAEKFAGKKVVVTGVLDAATDVIHVKSINEQKT